ncbi:MAG: relaxase/mobilization nuclease domain-containing protein [Lachnospiraceae bacterium]|nr:relaxase/mobilization nuclease domain-containing protein [Lachnospiraceae bacterium]
MVGIISLTVASCKSYLHKEDNSEKNDYSLKNISSTLLCNAIHTSTENLHIHPVFGAVNIMTGKKLHLDKESFKKHIENVKREAYQELK